MRRPLRRPSWADSAAVPIRKPGRSIMITSGRPNASHTAMKCAAFAGAAVEGATQVSRLIGHHADRPAAEPGETGDDIGCRGTPDLEQESASEIASMTSRTS